VWESSSGSSAQSGGKGPVTQGTRTPVSHGEQHAGLVDEQQRTIRAQH
jgi:hypothetical protein